MQTKKQFTFSDGYTLDYILDTGKRKNMYLCVRDGKVSLKTPLNLSEDKYLNFLISKEQWIKNNLFKSKPKAVGFTQFKNGESIMLLGEEYILKLVYADKYFKPYFSEKTIIAATSESFSEDRLKLSIEKLINEFAVKQIQDTISKYSQITGLYPKKITVKNMKSSWGRCSSDGSISINHDIIYHSRECLEYVIIHELCHLKHMNHSAEFWELVEHYCPDRKRIRKELNEQT
ncbi:MAG: M48 family metallopeptidase [Ruminococcus sp.]|nr:M48 family metallopeptidase [Ruminococcus sp.]